jgi:hypothetical protein
MVLELVNLRERSAMYVSARLGYALRALALNGQRSDRASVTA